MPCFCACIGLKTIDFPDVCLHLINNTHQPYRKPKSETVYVNKHSNHPQNTLKELPKAINKRITNISCIQDIFDARKRTYKQALHNSGFDEELKYKNKASEEQTRNKEKRVRKRKILLFNPPFPLSVNINIGKLFLKMLKKNFLKSNPSSKILK